MGRLITPRIASFSRRGVVVARARLDRAEAGCSLFQRSCHCVSRSYRAFGIIRRRGAQWSRRGPRARAGKTVCDSAARVSRALEERRRIADAD